MYTYTYSRIYHICYMLIRSQVVHFIYFICVLYPPPCLHGLACLGRAPFPASMSLVQCTNRGHPADALLRKCETPRRQPCLHTQMCKRQSPQGLPPPWIRHPLGLLCGAAFSTQKLPGFVCALGHKTDARNGPRIITKPSWNLDRIRTLFFSLSGTPNGAPQPLKTAILRA